MSNANNKRVKHQLNTPLTAPHSTMGLVQHVGGLDAIKNNKQYSGPN